MGRERLNLVGMKFGRLTIIEKIENDKYNRSRFKCICDCGNVSVHDGTSINIGKIKSCGCLKKEYLESVQERNKKYNTYDLIGEYGIGHTSKYNEFYFDLEDYDKIKDYCWCIDGGGYVVTGKNKDGRETKQHRLVLNSQIDGDVDHINHNKVDNRKCNLRIITHRQNCYNKTVLKDGIIKINGVNWREDHKRWTVTIGCNHKHIYIGEYKNKEDAIKVRLEAEVKYFGEYRNKNLN